MIVVTGGAGFIGSHLVRRLRAQGEEVAVLDNLSRSLSAFGRRVDITNFEEVDEFFASTAPSEVMHLAYVNGTKTFYERPAHVLEVGVRGMLNVMKACKYYNVRNFTLMSSSEVCRAEILDTKESIPLVIVDPFNPRYSYAAGKIISEMLAIHSGQFDKLLIARPFNVYGPGMSPGHVIPDFVEQARRIQHKGRQSRAFEILGSGAETRSFCYIDDFIDGITIMRERGEHMNVYNVGTPVETTILNLARKILELAGGVPSWIEESGKLREGDAPRRRPNIDKLAALGYSPKVDLDEGLRRTMLCV